MIQRTQKPGLIGYFAYFLGKDPEDIWEINIMGKNYTLVNKWKTGAKLYHQDELISENTEKFLVNSKKPFMTFFIKNSKVEIYAKALSSVKINVSVNGQFIQNEYV